MPGSRGESHVSISSRSDRRMECPDPVGVGNRDGNPVRRTRERGLTILELTIVMSVATILITGALSTINDLQDSFIENQIISRMQLRSQHALDRLTNVVGQALTSDSQLATLDPSSGVDSSGLRFRFLTNVVAGNPVYEDTLRVFVLGPSDAPAPCDGVIIGRGPSPEQIHTAAAGADGRLGTLDDDTSVSLGVDVPAVELLLPSTYAPSNGRMLTINQTPGSRLVTLTLRLNARRPDGTFVLVDDLVLTERVALRQ